jgi:hypothetical protein
MSDDPKENITFISVSPDELYEQIEDKDETPCGGSKCITAR